MTENFSRQANAEPGVQTFSGRATLGATIGNMLEFYDFVTYSFFAIQIGRTFFPSHSQFASLMLSLATFGAGFSPGRSAGSLLDPIPTGWDDAGDDPELRHDGIRHHRVGADPSYDAIGIAAPIIVIVARMVQGFSLGGEVGPTTAYLMEAAPRAAEGSRFPGSLRASRSPQPPARWSAWCFRR